MKPLHARAGAPTSFVLALLVCAGPALAADTRAAVEQFLRTRAEGLPGRVEITLSAAGALPACAEPQPFLPMGARAWGRVAVGVRCADGTAWTRYVSAYVAVIAPYQVAKRSIAPGEALEAEDAAAREGDLAALPAGVVTDPAELAGKVAMYRIAAGAPLRRELLRGVVVLRQGQDVRVLVRGPGFLAGVEGKALADAAVGATVQVKARNGRLLTGVAREDGSVEHAP
jgi:flagella basal body P-ring formation protein FlgA